MTETGGNTGYIDCHTHILPPKRMRKLIEWAKKFMPDHPVSQDYAVDDFLRDLKAAGAKRCVSTYYPIWPSESRELNRFAASLAEKHPWIVPLGGVHLTDSDPLSVVRETIEELGMAGLKFHPMVQRFSPAEDKLKPIYPYLNERQAVVYIHTGYDEWYGWRLPPEHVEWIIREHPRLGVVLCHIGFPRINWAFDLAENFPNVWLDTTNVFGTFAMFDKFNQDPHRQKTTNSDLRESMMQRLPSLAHRTFFGTDHPAGLGDINRILTDMKAFGLDLNTVDQILIHTPGLFLEKYAP